METKFGFKGCVKLKILEPLVQLKITDCFNDLKSYG